ncbi:hypothetical protein [Pseudomonas sp. PDM13]|uniref:hypothetical protein n=1 Tax=Pseudomonas sp. PDM13 TaxID=2769255 RepID=UPI0021E0FAD8|nr:hypothetical protein [Pseudomonas sp. PDM13]MCU9949827.1 hypothetical protein [Pseudomonas sp. PDM13]
MDKVLAAIVRHERAAQENHRLTTEVGAALARCPVNVELQNWSLPAHRRKELTTADGLSKTHLWEALDIREASPTGHGSERLSESEIADYLADDPACEHCQLAWQLLQQRKIVRSELGIAKRALRAIGRAALRKEAAHG